MTAPTWSRSGAPAVGGYLLPDRTFFRGMFTHYWRRGRFARPYWRLRALAGINLTLNSLAGLALPLVIRNVVDGALLQIGDDHEAEHFCREALGRGRGVG